MIILGIDPGTTRIGFGIIENRDNKISCLGYGVIKNQGTDMSASFRNTSVKIGSIIEKYKPDLVAIEKLFFFKNQKTVISVSEMRGAIITSVVSHGIPIKEYTPLEVKKAITNYGRADKAQVQDMISLILGIKDRISSDDAADALGIAICCSTSDVEIQG